MYLSIFDSIFYCKISNGNCSWAMGDECFCCKIIDFVFSHREKCKNQILYSQFRFFIKMKMLNFQNISWGLSIKLIEIKTRDAEIAKYQVEFIHWGKTRGNLIIRRVKQRQTSLPVCLCLSREELFMASGGLFWCRRF